MTLATPEPWAAAVFYVNEDFALHFLSAATTRHCVRLRADPRVAATVQDDTGNWQAIKGVQLEGTVAPVPGPSLKRVQALYTVTPTGVWFVDNARGFGHRDHIALQSGG
ncbi:MAG: hypothetical protein DYH14_13225 [Betaproteobacteria bacterium PRO3]|nr:hypothetical protein [Betaproteobacteria bacterium PRO3]